MRILWITNIMMPPLCERMDMLPPSVGGWMYSSLKRIQNMESKNSYAVATVWQGKTVKIMEIEGIKYFLLPLNGKDSTKYNSDLEKYWITIKNEIHPDIVHIHGTEYPHGLAYVRACGKKGVVVSIQGLVSCIAEYYFADILKMPITFRDFIRGNLKKQQQSFKKRGEYEIELLKRVDHIIGRTEWDRSHSWAINPKAHYHYVGETLRDSFYRNKWSYKKIELHSIFVSQASYPIKGLHILLQALPIVLRYFPDTKVYVAGNDELNKPWYRITGYSKYLKGLIDQNGLSKSVIFTGNLNEEQMCKRYLSSNLFICCSAIENSPNSLGEAQVLGMPYLAAFVGGVPEIVKYNQDVLYRFEESKMLAKKICEVFSKEEKVKIPDFDSKRYDVDVNLLDLDSTYKKVYHSFK